MQIAHLLKLYLFFGLMFGTLVSPTSASQDFSSCSQLVVTGNAEYPPILWRSHDRKLHGIAIELLELALIDTGIKVVARDRGVWGRALKEAEHGSVDMIAGAFKTNARVKYLDYIEPQFTDVLSMVWVKKGHDFPFHRWQDLLGKRGGTLANNSFGQAFDQYAKSHLSLYASGSAERSFEMLMAERFDYFLYELYQGLALLELAGLKQQVSALPSPISVEPLYFAFSKKSACNTPRLKLHLQQHLSQLSEFKVFERLFDKHLQLWLSEQSQNKLALY
ncbi:substrate-binding periplasmic protein [Agarivorans sp. QJM3NY_25]|uniref:substrate-binding periplasmic protein n=1 Tax=Agarivorans sp. QJM3NY_25 TaxID=3421430 RepID=UPI003D7DE183